MSEPKAIADLRSLLNAARADYSIFSHKENVASAEDGVTRGLGELRNMAPTLILKSEAGYMAAVIPGDRRISYKALKRRFGLKDVSLANLEEVRKVTGTDAGSVSLVNPGLKTVVDEHLMTAGHAYGGCGIPGYSLRIKAADLVKVTGATVFSFSTPKGKDPEPRPPPDHEEEPREFLHSGALATFMDFTVAGLYLATWVSPNLIYAGMFEALATYLAAELVVMFMLMVAAKQWKRPMTRQDIHSGWNMTRWILLLFFGYQSLESGNWQMLLFVAVVLMTTDFPLRIASHREWMKQLTVDAYLILAVLMVNCLIMTMISLPPMQAAHVPREGIANFLVEGFDFQPAKVLAFGTVHFGAKALLSGYRFGSELLRKAREKKG